MPAAPLPDNESQRVQALRSLCVLDTPPEPGFDELTKLASECFGMPIALVSLVDEQRQWFKSHVGVSVCETDRDISICSYVILQDDVLVIEDLACDPRTSDNELVTGDMRLRFYAGAPIVLSSGEAVGAFCVLDTEPRTMSDSDRRMLERMASICATQLEQRRSSELRRSAEDKLRSIQNATPMAVLHLEPVRDARTRVVDFTVLDANRTAAKLLRLPFEALAGSRLLTRMPGLLGAAGADALAMLRSTLSSRDPGVVEFAYADGRISADLLMHAVSLGEGMVLTIDDITDRVAQEKEIERSRDLLEQTQAVSGVGGWDVTIETGALHWTEHTFLIHGMRPEDGVPDVETAIAFYTPEDQLRIRSAIDEMIKHQTPYDIEAEIIRADGVRVPVRAIGHPVVQQGVVVRLVGAFQDLTKVKEQADERQRLADMIKSITDASTDVIFIKDRESRMLFGNPAFEEAVGRPLSELIGMPTSSFMGEAAYEEIRKSEESVLETGKPVRVEERIAVPGRGGEIRLLESEKHPYRLPDGTIGGVIGVVRDITDVRAAIEEVETSKQRLNFALSTAGVGYWDHNLETDEVHYANSWYTMLGYEPGEIPMTLDCFWSFLLHPEDHDTVRAAHDAYLAGKTESYDVQIRLKRKNGSWHHVRDIGTIIERDSSGRPTRIVGVHVDVDQQHRSRERLQTALYAANEGLWEWSIPDNRCYFDEMWFRLLGYEPDELPQEFETWESLCHPDDIESTKFELGRYLRGETEQYAAEHRLWTKQGAWKWVLGTGKITERDEAGRPTRVVGVNLDIDDRMHAAETLEGALDQAEAANAAKSQFLANMSHEIRTPMTAILGYAELMVTDEQIGMDQQRMRETAGIIRRNGEHLLAIINDILDLSKIDAGKMTVESVRTNPLDVICEVHELLRGRAVNKGIRFELQQRDPLPDAIVSDPVRVRQILMNLIQNAIKFTEQGGVIIRVESASDPASLRISVIDTGIGMSDEQVEKLFGAFQQADDSMARRFGGTGLGLAISRRLAELMGGSLRVTSRFGRGSVFTFEMPMHLADGARWFQPGETPGDESGPAAGADADEGEPIAGTRILLVDDGPDNQRLISYHLRRAEAEVAIASNGEEALQCVAEANHAGEPFDLILLDMQMPVMDGYTAARTLRDRGESLPIIALTAHAMSGDRNRCIAAGCDEYETKPISKQRLIELCTQWRAQRRRAA